MLNFGRVYSSSCRTNALGGTPFRMTISSRSQLPSWMGPQRACSRHGSLSWPEPREVDKYEILRLMEEIPNNHLRCFWNPVNNGIFTVSTGERRISSINSMELDWNYGPWSHVTCIYIYIYHLIQYFGFRRKSFDQGTSGQWFVSREVERVLKVPVPNIAPCFLRWKNTNPEAYCPFQRLESATGEGWLGVLQMS